MKLKHAIAHMKSAFNYAECSTAKRLQVGCILVKNDRIISIGYNGMPSGWDNVCETTSIVNGKEELVTKPEVLHAESNAIAKLARCMESGQGATAFITHQPCLSCAKLLYQAGIKEVYYCNEYRCDDGIEFLMKCNISLTKITKETLGLKEEN